MSIQKTKAIILHSRKQGETSKLLTLFAMQFGKMTLMAKGSRSMKSRHLGVLEPFTEIALVFYRKELREIQYLSQAEISQAFPNLHAELGKMALAAIACEMIAKCEQTAHPHFKLYQLLRETLTAINLAQKGTRNILRSFQMNYLRLSGFGPDLSKCAACGASELHPKNIFALDRGVYTCSPCGIVTSFSMELTDSCLRLLRWLEQTMPAHAGEQIIPAALGRETDFFLIQYLKLHMEGLAQLSSLDYLQQLEQNLIDS